MSTQPLAEALRIIVVDDHDWIRQILVQVVRQTLPEVEVIELKNGAEALKAFKSRGCEFLVTDHSMPCMNGPELVIQVRARSPDLPILMVSVHLEAKSEAMAAGANWFLTKEQIMEYMPRLLLDHTFKRRGDNSGPRGPSGR